MKYYKVEEHLSEEEVVSQMKKAEKTKQYRQWQSLYLIQIKRLKVKEISSIINTPQKTIYGWLNSYNNDGPSAFDHRVRSSRPGALMSLEEEASLLDELRENATEGLIVIAKTIKQKAEMQLGREVSNSYAYGLLHRHGWRKIAPHTIHPDCPKEEQELFKKNSRN